MLYLDCTFYLLIGFIKLLAKIGKVGRKAEGQREEQGRRGDGVLNVS
jgi:hypothetical protein